MNTRLLLGLLGVLGAAACAADTDPQEEPTEQKEIQELGTLSLSLTGADTSGRAYRLRNAEFEIYGYPEFVEPMPGDGDGDGDFYPQPYSKVVSTESDPDAENITERVVPGSYDINFVSTNWYLERFEGGAWERVEQAVLLSSRWQYTYVSHGSVSRVAYRFGVDGELIDFRAGEIQIDIEIEQPGEGPANPPCSFPPIPGFPFPWPCPGGDAGVEPTPGDAGMPIPPQPGEDAGVAEPDLPDAGIL